MTANKDFKRRVRERARRTGESYTAALRQLRRNASEVTMEQWKRIEKPEFDYAVQVPLTWIESAPNLNNSPWETARFGDPADRRCSFIVFRSPSPRDDSPIHAAESAQMALEASGFVEFRTSDAAVAGRSAARLDCARYDAGRLWAVREYFVVRNSARFCLGLGSSVPDQHAALFDEIVDRFALLTAT
jgi:hypothetical protein